MRHHATLLLTAFGAFPGVARNPSERLVAQLQRQHGRRLARLGIDLRTIVLPVIFCRVGDELADHLMAVAPNAIILVGTAGRRPHISVELRAMNRLTTLRPDASGRCSAARHVIAGAPFAFAARWPALRLCIAMNRAGAMTRTSFDAGDYVCNQTLYMTLARTGLPAGFLHIPHPAGRRRISTRSPRRPTLSQMLDSLAVAIIHLMADVRRHA